jgi:hypothetical protein
VHARKALRSSEHLKLAAAGRAVKVTRAVVLRTVPDGADVMIARGAPDGAVPGLVTVQLACFGALARPARTAATVNTCVPSAGVL